MVTMTDLRMLFCSVLGFGMGISSKMFGVFRKQWPMVQRPEL